ncbi:MAG: carbohydrate ABC transporter permease [Firmicutes bacterium]|nr:carbohydrate ABC transporter permease [Bacillota bacterium]
MKHKKNALHGLSDKASDVILVAITAVILFIVAYPLYYILVASVSNPYDVYAGKTFLLPSGFTLSGYVAVFADSSIFTGYLNSIKYTIIGTIFSVVMVYITAYPLSRHDLPGRKWISLFFIITMYFGGGLVPTYLVVKNTGLLNSMWALFLPGGVSVANAIIVRNFFENSIPKELMEAAEIDGAGHMTVFLRIVVPLSKSIMAVMVVFSMVAYWNDWFTALIYLKADKAPLPLVLRNILIKSSASASQSSTISGGYAELNKLTESLKFCSMVVAAVPMLILYPFVQKYFEQGFMAGAVKG